MSENDLNLAVDQPLKFIASTRLSEIYQIWLQAEWPNHLGQQNAQREPAALNNYQRALRAISYANGYNGDLTATPASTLLEDIELIGNYVQEGLLLEAQSKGKAAPRNQLTRNMQSNARAIAKFALANYKSNYKSGFRKLRDKPGRKRREGMQYLDWPQSLRADLERFEKWLADTLPSNEIDFRPRKLAPASIEGFRHRLGQYVKWRLTNNLFTNCLYDLVNERDFVNYINDYFSDENSNLGGHSGVKMCAISLASVIGYLVATEQLNPATGEPTPNLYRSNILRTRSQQKQRLEECKLFKRVFYRIGEEVLEDGEMQNSLIRNSRVQGWTPKDLLYLRDRGFKTPPKRMGNQTAARMEHFTRKRSATIFGISSETPLRIRTLTLITWDDMTQLEDGRWKVLIPAEKLKIKRRKRKATCYQMTYSLGASKFIDEYRKILSEHFGEKFESDVPNIFPAMDISSKNGRQCSTKSLGRGMTQLSLELRDVWFNPHSTRHIVATYVIQNLGAPGIVVAAKLLGDNPETVLKFYLNELSDEAKEIDQYFNLLNFSSTA